MKCESELCRGWRTWFRLVLLANAFVLAAMLLPAESDAQQPRRYQPYRPTLPSQLDFFRRNTSTVLDRYNAVVRPRQQLRADLSRQNQINLQQRTRIQALQGQLGRFLSGDISPTGTGSSFMNYSHYYSLRRN